MKELCISLLCALSMTACLTTEVLNWAGDSQPLTPRPIQCGVDADGSTVILVSVDGDEQASFSLRVPPDWQSRTQIPVGEDGESIHSPLYLEREPVLEVTLEPAPEEWFLRHEPESGSLDILAESGGGYVVVGTAELPSDANWGRRLAATILTPVTVLIDSAAMVGGFLISLWLHTEFPWPWGADSHDDSGGGYSSDPPEPSSEFIFPAHGPS